MLISMCINFIHISQFAPLTCITILSHYAVVCYSNLSLSPWERKNITLLICPHSWNNKTFMRQ